MSEEKMEIPVEEEAQAETGDPAESEATEANIANELQELGRQLTAATKAVLDSPEAHQVGAQLQRGLESLQKAVNQLVTQARDTKVGKKVESSVSEAATTVKERGMLESLAESVASALQAVNETLGQAVEKAQARAEETKKTTPQQIEVVEAEEETSAGSEAGEE